MPYKKMAGTVYELLQERPQMQATIEHTFFENPHFHQMIDFVLKGSSLVPEVLQNLERAPTFDRAKPTIFITTHVEQEMAAITLMNKGLIKGPGVIAAIPDPWREGSLVSMSSPIKLKEDKGLHVVIVHDYATAREFRRLRPNSGAKVFPLGTASDPYFLFHPGEEYDHPFHIGIEFSGNYLHKYGELIIRFIQSIKNELSRGMIALTVHAMHHEKSVRRLEHLLYELDIANLGNIRLLYAHTVEEAIDTRRKYSRGTLDAGWPAPHVVISKGGEVPLEHRGRQLIVGVWGEGHEEQDILAGVHEGRAVDFRGLPPTEWYSTILEVYRKREDHPPSVPQSLAVFAPLLLIDPQYCIKLSEGTTRTRCHFLTDESKGEWMHV
jgi:hypothetical protein